MHPTLHALGPPALHGLIERLVLDKDGVPDREVWFDLHDRITLDDALVLDELRMVGLSHRHAQLKNNDALAARKREIEDS